MAVVQETAIYRFIVDGSTTKPTSASQIALGQGAIPIGSTCWDYTNNVLYKTYDGTNWVLYPYNN